MAVLVQACLPGRTDAFFALSFDDLETHGRSAHQQVEPIGTGEELVGFPRLLVGLVKVDDIAQGKSGRRGNFLQVFSIAGLVLVHRVLVESLQRLGREAIVAGRDVRASDDLERGISTSSHADVGSLKRAEGSIKGDGLVVR